MEQADQSHAVSFTEDEWQRIDEIIGRHAGKEGSLIPALEEIQGVTGFLPESIQRYAAAGLDIPLSHVYGVVTFYSFFTMEPRGKYHIRCCQGTACHVRGAKRNLEKMERTLGIKAGSCTDDRMFSIEVVRCLGACGLAPVMTVNDDTYKQVKESQIPEILNDCTDSQDG